MLVRWVTFEDTPAWIQLATTVADLFNSPTMATNKSFHDYMIRKIKNFEALAAIDRMSSRCLGIIGFSRTNNRISWFAVQPDLRGKGIGKRLLDTALRHLDNTKDITVVTFPTDHEGGQAARIIYQKVGFVDERVFTDEDGNKRCIMIRPSTNEERGGSFHYNYVDYDKYSKLEHCLYCNNTPAPDNFVEIAELEHSSAIAEKFAQGKLFGKCHVIIKNHYVNFEDIPHDEMVGFMSEVQQVGKALHRVTEAMKINYEIHANSGPHIHCHLFPRYLDDDFPSAPIDYRVCEPSPYESKEEFMWFVEQMREQICPK
jgi:diadenosine tetraphosphate (Ap4A) HIT family hydrolase/ribosomal protein S18 acetylase RimI-like enzyme